MFTGIIQEIGTVQEALPIGGGIRLTIEAHQTASDLKTNDSVSVNGVCQTVVDTKDRRFTVVAVEETLLKTTLGSLGRTSRVNIELPLRLGDRLGGHIVSGHVDCVGEISSIERRDTSWLFRVSVPRQFKRYVIFVGSIAIDGVSLTVASIEGDIVTVSIIPHTMQKTIFSSYTPQTRVNLEFDLLGKYVERLLESRSTDVPANPISAEQLKMWGYDV